MKPRRGARSLRGSAPLDSLKIVPRAGRRTRPELSPICRPDWNLSRMKRSLPMSRCLALIALLLAVSSARAQKPEEMGTTEHRAAGSHDVGSYCKPVKPDDRL